MRSQLVIGWMIDEEVHELYCHSLHVLPGAEIPTCLNICSLLHLLSPADIPQTTSKLIAEQLNPSTTTTTSPA